jgi:hypothetical protein
MANMISPSRRNLEEVAVAKKQACSKPKKAAVNGSSAATNGFRHHRPKEKRPENDVVTEVIDPKNAEIDYADDERGAITKLLALNATEVRSSIRLSYRHKVKVIGEK